MVASTITCWHNFTIHYLVLCNMAQSGTILWSYYFTLFQKKCKNNCLHYNLPVQFHLIWHTMKALNSPPYPGRKFDFPQKIGKTWWWWWCSMLFGVLPSSTVGAFTFLREKSISRAQLCTKVLNKILQSSFRQFYRLRFCGVPKHSHKYQRGLTK